VEVRGDGQRISANITHDEAVDYATASAKAFGVGQSRTFEFDKKRAVADLKGEAPEGDRPPKKGRK
jgi:CRISPR-associated protein Csb1